MPLAVNQLIGFGAGGGYTAFGSDFDGTNDDMLRGGDLTGSVDGKTALFSGWFSKHSQGSNEILLGNGSFRFEVLFNTSDEVRVNGRNVSGGTILDIRTTATFGSDQSWFHVLSSYDVGTAGRRHIFIDDVEDTNEVAFTNQLVDYTQTEWALGARTDESLRYEGCMSEIYLALEWFDITVEANRRKFISAGKKPVSLGADGSRPTGTAPILYLPKPFGSFQENAGSGGDFTVTGALAACATSPSG